MILGVIWPDLVIGFILAFGALIGIWKGFIRELCGTVALFVAVVAGFHYNGIWDDAFLRIGSLHRDSAHTFALIAFAATFYIITFAVGFFADRVAQSPGLNVINAILGAFVGFAKALFFVWILLSIALLVSLPLHVRHDLQTSTLAHIITTPNDQFNEAVRKALPWFEQPFAKDYFKRDRL
ncbi:MAG TPA: CvpA family protein [Candidatus Baltobacteraceae bacterium]|jgi:uncharacterized membrane protein required for colicin V production|nr:CvpA family protein [Candidatus Baltobacteraceae bacterium]